MKMISRNAFASMIPESGSDIVEVVGTPESLPHGLLACDWIGFLSGIPTGPRAHGNLDEA